MALRTKAARIAIVPLLFILVGVWTARRAILPPIPMTPSQTGAVPTGAPAGQTLQTPPAPVTPLTLPTRDPFQPPAAVSSALPPNTLGGAERSSNTAPLRLQGIVWGIQPPRAIVNDRILTAGDTVAGGQVVAIDPEGVTVEYQGQRTVLRLPGRPAGLPSSPASKHD